MRSIWLKILFIAMVAGCSGGSKDKRAVKSGQVTLGDDAVTPGVPHLTSVTPASAPVGSVVTLTGTDLGATGTVVFGTAEASGSMSWSDTSIKVVVPAAAGGNVYVKTGGLVSNKLPFTALPGGGGGCGGCGAPANWPTMLTGTLQGTITDAFAAPATGARVEVADNPSFTLNVRSATASASGAYSLTLPAGTFYVRAGKDGNANGAFFDAAYDQIGFGGAAVIIENRATNLDVGLAQPADGSITGTLTVDASWGAIAGRVVSFDRSAGSVRYAAVMTAASYFLPERVGLGVGVVGYVDVNANGMFDANVEPAVTVNGNVAANATGINGAIGVKRTIGGVVSNAPGWTVVAVGASTDPAGNNWLVGSQVLGSSGAFSMTTLAATYDLVVFQDVNHNGVPDNGELQYDMGTYSASVADIANISFPVPGPTQGLLTGTVRDSTGTRTTAQVVIAHDPNFSSIAATLLTDTRGNYGILLAPGNYYLKAGKDVNSNGNYFQAGVDEIGYNAVFTVNLGLVTGGADVTLDLPAQAAISGTVTTAVGVTSWGASRVGMASWDLNAGVSRGTAFGDITGAYALAEATGATVGVVAFRDSNGNGKYDRDFEPARTVNAGVAAPATGVNYAWSLDKRTTSGTVVNGAGWTLYLQDRSGALDPAGARWVLGKQALGNGGAFALTGVSGLCRLYAFHDSNGNGIPDLNEPNVRLVNAAGTNLSFDMTAADATNVTAYVPPSLVVQSAVLSADANHNGSLAPSETGTYTFVLRNDRGPLSNATYTITALQNGSVFGATTGSVSLAYGAASQFSVGITAAAVAPGQQLRLRITVSGGTPGVTATRDLWVPLFAAAPYVSSSIAYQYADLSTNGSTVELWGAEQDQSSAWIDFQGGTLFPTTDFAFPFYGVWMTDGTASPFNNGLNMGIDVGDNGYIDLLNANAQNNPEALPSTNGNTQFLLMPLWTDVMPGRVLALVTGAAPNRVLTIQWVDAARWTTPTLKMDFSVKLYETTGVIDVLYNRVVVTAGDRFGVHYGDGQTMTGLPAPTNMAGYRLTPNW